MKPDSILIVGKGLAGTTLAFRLLQRDIPFRIVDPLIPLTSSEVASGLINPVVVKTLGLSWNAPILVPEAVSFYRWIETITQSSFSYPMNIFRVFQSDHDIKLWNTRRNAPDANQFMLPAPETPPDGIHPASKAGAIISSAFRIDTQCFLEATTRYLTRKELLIKSGFEYSSLQHTGPGLHWNGQHYSNVVFCEGTGLAHNPWFGSLPVSPLKGQLLDVKINRRGPKMAVSDKIFLLPMTNGTHKVGATYERSSEPGNTPEAINYLSENLTRVLGHHDFEILHAWWGFRPTVPDRRPLLGPHPTHIKLWVFNGLGSKGYMMAPWLSLILAESLIENQSIPAEVDARRYLK